ncbi:hypothetical protein ENSA5_56600 [Enhygromyxa salina]|uniref:Uncharacterized protein n=1 Tax=Enhygromyxa salina TaxID=215803 RepID=A0A2S9XF61_9BACT|nr:hypothetical protein [Enhygromyxa salina]PRP91311.1 hypothetical protein ENSA5_56600 [Enhygromyxa salina]
MSTSTPSFRTSSRPALVLALGLSAGLGLGCDRSEPSFGEPLVERGLELEQSETPSLTADQVLAEAAVEGYVEVPLDELSDAALDELVGASDEVPEFESLTQRDNFLAYAQGELVLRNSSPLGAPGAGFEWSELSTVEEHGRVLEFLAQRGLLDNFEDELPPGTWLTPELVAKGLSPAESADLAAFEFESFVTPAEGLEPGGPAPLTDCGPTQVETWCGQCTLSHHFAWNYYIQLWLRTCHRRVFNNCTCFSATQWAEPC